ncbi:MAG: hypothetical protein ACLRL6_02850 [Clostridium sp.]
MGGNFRFGKGWIPVEVTPGFESESKPSSQTTVQGQEQGGTTTAKTETPKSRQTGKRGTLRRINKSKRSKAICLQALPRLVLQPY